MADARDTLREELNELCRDIPASELLLVVRLARDAAARVGTGPEAALDPGAERQRRVEAMESWLSLASAVGRQIPPGTTVVRSLEDDRNEREHTLRGRGSSTRRVSASNP